VLLIVSLVVTGVLTWAAAHTHDNSNKSLLRLEVRQVAATLGHRRLLRGPADRLRVGAAPA
jgi:hypothetical protein